MYQLQAIATTGKPRSALCRKLVTEQPQMKENLEPLLGFVKYQFVRVIIQSKICFLESMKVDPRPYKLTVK